MGFSLSEEIRRCMGRWMREIETKTPNPIFGGKGGGKLEPGRKVGVVISTSSTVLFRFWIKRLSLFILFS
jgi:hypothetical protein